MGKVYLLSSLIVPLSFEYKKAIIEVEEVGVEEVVRMLKGGFISAVGHPSTASLLTKLLGVTVNPDRRTVSLESGDIAIALQFKKRVQRTELKEDELEKIFREGGIRILKLKIKEASR